MQCNNCGHELVAGADFCGNCGVKLINPAAMPYQPASSQPAPTVQINQPGAVVSPPPAVPSSEPVSPASPILSATPSPVNPGQFQPNHAQSPGAQTVVQAAQPSFPSSLAATSPAPASVSSPVQPGSISPQQVQMQSTTYQNPTYAPTGQLQQVPQPMQTAPGHAYAVPRQPSNGLSIASMVTGIVSILLFWTVILSIPLSVMALIFGLIGKGKGSKGMAMAGIITGVVGLLLTIVLIVFALATEDIQEPAESGFETSSDVQEVEIIRDVPEYLYGVPERLNPFSD